MSRSYSSYDADWQRRKSMLIRSLFHDIPILSPVEEESNGSSQNYYVPTEDVFASPPRSYTPLPPLIIEKVPITNKHDEPEEYYSKLHKKMKRIYKKLFIENRNISSIDCGLNYIDSSYSDSSNGSVENLDLHLLESHSPDDGNFDSIIEDRDASQSSASTKSDGYGADFESMDTAIIDVVNYTPSNEDDLMKTEEEESDSESTDGAGIRNEEEESNELEDEQSYEKEGSDNENIYGNKIPEETTQTGASDGVRIGDPVFSGVEESHYSSIDVHEMSESEESNEIEDEPQPNHVTQTKQDWFEKELKSEEFVKIAFEDGNQSMEGDVETSDSSEGPAYRQITTTAMIHVDGSQDAEERESRVYEDSVKSVILPTRFRRRVVSRNVGVDDRIEVLEILEDNADSKTTTSFYTDESETTEEDFEEVATSRLEAKEEGIIEMRTPQADAPEEDDEEMTSPQSDSTEEDVEGIGSPQPAARDEEPEKLGILLPEATEEDVEEMRTPPPDASKEDDKRISTPDSVETDVEGMEIPQPAAIDEKTVEMGMPLPEATEVDVEEMGTPRLDAPEEDDEETTTSQSDSTEEDVERMGRPQTAARDKETKATEVDVEEMESHFIEQMRTPRPDLSHGTIPITHRSHSESTSEHTAAPQEATALTSSTQDGADHNMSEIQISNDMHEILTSIFNESRNKDETRNSRKRKLVDKSVQAVQTSRVTWEEMRANFFIGTPKIFRLCACTDHICY